MEREYGITDSDDMYAYFAIIDQLKPKSVLDAGMFLKRIGAVARQVCNGELPADMRLDAVDYIDVEFPIYRTVYDNIYKGEIPQRRYDLIMALYLKDIIGEDETTGVMNELKSIIKSTNEGSDTKTFLVTEYSQDIISCFEDAKSIQSAGVGEKRYLIIEI